MFLVLLFIELLVIGIDSRDRPFDCPKDCPLNFYEPICSRGISYANLCTLKQEICDGKIDNDVYGDIEPCPKFSKDKDIEDAMSIDKNGVILRSLFSNDGNNNNNNYYYYYYNNTYTSAISKENQTTVILYK